MQKQPDRDHITPKIIIGKCLWAASRAFRLQVKYNLTTMLLAFMEDQKCSSLEEVLSSHPTDTKSAAALPFARGM
jgi:hypothetical protein